jgi:predicted phage terminase large subunit-like protein
MTSHANINVIDAMYRTDFASFIGKCFNTLAPNSKFHMNWHILAAAYHLDQVRLGKIKRLVMTMPPRSLKSVMSSVAFPAFVLGHDPSKRLIAASYGSELAIKHANDCRLILNSSFYQRAFPQTRISRLKNTEHEIVTTLNGSRLTTSIDGTLTGRGGDIVIVDDPLKPIDALSDSRRERANDWFNHTLLSRLDDKREGAIILLAQRLHQDDLPGTVLRASDEWTWLNLPAIAVQDERIKIGENRYHIRRVGDLLHPKREPMEVLDSLRSQQGSDTFAAQYQQEPVPPGGALIKRAWVRRYDQLPVLDSSSIIVQSWDTATKEGGENDYSVCTTWLIRGNKYYLIDVMRGRFNYPTLKARAASHARAHRANKILIEDTGVGTALIAELQSDGLPVIAVKPEHNKLIRMSVQSAKFESGQVFFPNQAPWLADLESELFAFPGARHDDQVDSISQALAHHLSGYGWNERNLRGLGEFTAAICGW